MDGRLRLTVTRLETLLCLRDLVSRPDNMDETVLSSSPFYMCAYINVGTLCVFKWMTMRCDTIGYPGAIHLGETSFIIDVGYGMQCSCVTEGEYGDVTLNSKLLVGQMIQ